MEVVLKKHGHFYICIAANFPEAMRIGEGMDPREAFKDAFGLDFKPERHVSMFATSRLRDIQTDKKRREYFEKAQLEFKEKNRER